MSRRICRSATTYRPFAVHVDRVRHGLEAMLGPVPLDHAEPGLLDELEQAGGRGRRGFGVRIEAGFADGRAEEIIEIDAGAQAGALDRGGRDGACCGGGFDRRGHLDAPRRKAHATMVKAARPALRRSARRRLRGILAHGARARRRPIPVPATRRRPAFAPRRGYGAAGRCCEGGDVHLLGRGQALEDPRRGHRLAPGLGRPVGTEVERLDEARDARDEDEPGEARVVHEAHVAQRQRADEGRVGGEPGVEREGGRRHRVQ